MNNTSGTVERLTDDPLGINYEINNVADLIAVVNTLREQLETHPEDWENVTLGPYLQAIAAWLDTVPQLYINLGRQTPVPDWGFVADVLRAGRVYE